MPMLPSKQASLFLALGLCAGCGIENFGNLGRSEYERPASAISGKIGWDDSGLHTQYGVTDGENALTPFLINGAKDSYEIRLPSSKYSMIEITARAGNGLLRGLVPSIGEESKVDLPLDARAMTEALIVEARLSADGKPKLKEVDASAYLGTRNLIYRAFDEPGPTQELLNMVEAFFAHIDPTIASVDPDFFTVPVYNPDFTVASRGSAIAQGALARSPFDYTGDGVDDNDSTAFDAKLGEVAQLYRPAGCPDPDNIRLVLTVDFNTSVKNGVCGAIDRFKWATDKPGKTMFFVGWVHKDSVKQDPGVNSLLGAGVPNQIQMYDDGTNGDAVAGDNIYTITFVIPRGDPSTGEVFRIGYKFTWGVRGALWSGSEEWPGNSRILEVVDVNGDGFVYRHESFGDEASNKDNSNLNPLSGGSISWTTDLHGCGPEARENSYDFPSCNCTTIETPKGVGPINVACQ